MSQNSLPLGLLEEIEKKVPGLYSKVTPDEGDDMRTRVAEYILTEKRPDVMLIHLFDLDHFEHEYGPFTSEAIAMLEKSDTYVARLLEALSQAGTLNDTAVFITSDHGFKPISRQIHPGVLLKNAGLVEFKAEKDKGGKEQNLITNWKAAVSVSGASCAIYLKDPNDKESLRRLHEIFDPLAGRPESGIRTLLDENDIDRLGSNTSAVMMLDPAEGFTFGSNYFGEYNVPSRSKGMHGYLPDTPEFLASFIASGAGVSRRGWIDEMGMPDAGATIAAAIGLTLKDATGKPSRLR
jgi:predicted AlkP superfamily pyrophosphatase or phosphodiesterase